MVIKDESKVYCDGCGVGTSPKVYCLHNLFKDDLFMKIHNEKTGDVADLCSVCFDKIVDRLIENR